MSTTPTPRQKLVGRLRAWPHRYDRLRALSITFSVAVLFAIPLGGLARFDAWDGAHLVLGDPSDGVTALGAVGIAVAGFYIATFLVNAGLGRLFCGWGCPVGQLCRIGEASTIARRRRKDRLRALSIEVAYALVLAAAVLSYFVSFRVLVAGSARAVATTAGVWLGLAAVLVLHGRSWQWSFCRRACPIGLYYSAVQTVHSFGIHFDAARATCKACGACDRVCPVELPPRDLERPISDIGGLAVDGMPARHHCLTCGDCVRICEHVFRGEDPALVPLRLGLQRPPRVSPP